MLNCLTQILFRHSSLIECGGLTGKPKLFFIQACQGQTHQRGVENDGKFCLHNFFMKLLLYFTIILLHNSDI